MFDNFLDNASIVHWIQYSEIKHILPISRCVLHWGGYIIRMCFEYLDMYVQRSGLSLQKPKYYVQVKLILTLIIPQSCLPRHASFLISWAHVHYQFPQISPITMRWVHIGLFFWVRTAGAINLASWVVVASLMIEKESENLFVMTSPSLETSFEYS